MKHIPLRLAWHDDGWNGLDCKKPRANTHCVGQHSYSGDLISYSRNLEWEEQKNATILLLKKCSSIKYCMIN